VATTTIIMAAMVAMTAEMAGTEMATVAVSRNAEIEKVDDVIGGRYCTDRDRRQC